VHRFFGSKERLFVAAMELPVAPSELVRALLAEGSERLGERIVQTLLAVYDVPEAVVPFVALLRAAASNEQAAAMLREFVTTEVLGPIAATAAPDQPDLRAALAGSQVIGLAMARYLLRIPQIANARPQQLATQVGPAIQNYLTGTLPAPALAPATKEPR
jgi:AcrR family transcriptional regulator